MKKYLRVASVAFYITGMFQMKKYLRVASVAFYITGIIPFSDRG